MKICISGTGCALADFIYTNIDFSRGGFLRYRSKLEGDGGLRPGALIFSEELERFSGKVFPEVEQEIAGNLNPDVFNVGGPSLVSLVHVSQLLENSKYEVNFYGMAGNDAVAGRIFEVLEGTPLNIDNYLKKDNSITPTTTVFSDPTYNRGQGERTFVNNMGAAQDYRASMLDDSFFDSQIVCFGGTALVPQIHDNLDSILKRAKGNDCLTVVNTVYDFRNEKKDPASPWPLVKDFSLIDVLIMSQEEANRISGQSSYEKVIDFFISSKVSSFVITNGSSDLIAFSHGKIFRETSKAITLPVAGIIGNEILKIPEFQRDTTGCGDNFAGGVIASIASQMAHKPVGEFDLVEALSWATVSGGLACLYAGGVYSEKAPGEKLKKVNWVLESYIKQVEDK